MARTYALNIGLDYVKDRYSAQKADGSEHQEIVTMCCVIKPLCGWNVENVSSICRERCGGQGYLAANRFGMLIFLYPYLDGTMKLRTNSLYFVINLRNKVLSYLHHIRLIQPFEAYTSTSTLFFACSSLFIICHAFEVVCFQASLLDFLMQP